MKLKDLGILLKPAAVGWWNDKAQRLGAALAFYTILSHSPLLVITISSPGSPLAKRRPKDASWRRLRR